MLRIVHIDDDPDDVEFVRLALQRAAVAAEVRRVEDEAELRASLGWGPHLVLCDYHMPVFSADKALAILGETRNAVPLILVTRAIGEEAVVSLFRAGARDYVGKDKLALLPAAIERVLRESELAAERERTAAALADANARLRLLSARLVDAQERERSQIARNLHDSLGQVLTAIVIHLHAASRGGTPDDAERCRFRALELAQQAISQVKSMSFQLRPTQLDLLGMAAAARAMIDRSMEASGVDAVLRVRGAMPEQPAPSHAVALHILQEALTNVLRHARAQRVVVRLRGGEGGRLVLTVGDDGTGFDPHSTLSGGVRESNLGLHGMLERAELMGGRLRLRSTAGRGTVLRLTL